jgi:chromosome segregation ATPase
MVEIIIAIITALIASITAIVVGFLEYQSRQRIAQLEADKRDEELRREKSERQQQKLQSALDVISVQVERANDVLDMQQRMNAGLEQKNQDLTTRLTSLDDDNRQQRKDITELVRENRDLSQQIERMTSAINAQKMDYGQKLDRQQREHESMLIIRDRTIANLEVKVEEIAQERQERGQMIIRLEAKLDDKQTKIDELVAENLALDERVQVLEQRLEEQAESPVKQVSEVEVAPETA